MAKVSRQVHEILSTKDIKKYMEFKMIGKGMAWIFLAVGILAVAGRSMAMPGVIKTDQSLIPTTSLPSSSWVPSPGKARADLKFDFSKLKYNIKLSWDKAELVNNPRYIISRNGVTIGYSSTNSFTDTAKLSSKSSYIYSIQTLDHNQSRSEASETTVKPECFWAFCDLK